MLWQCGLSCFLPNSSQFKFFQMRDTGGIRRHEHHKGDGRDALRMPDLCPEVNGCPGNRHSHPYCLFTPHLLLPVSYCPESPREGATTTELHVQLGLQGYGQISQTTSSNVVTEKTANCINYLNQYSNSYSKWYIFSKHMVEIMMANRYAKVIRDPESAYLDSTEARDMRQIIIHPVKIDEMLPG